MNRDQISVSDDDCSELVMAKRMMDCRVAWRYRSAASRYAQYLSLRPHWPTYKKLPVGPLAICICQVCERSFVEGTHCLQNHLDHV